MDRNVPEVERTRVERVASDGRGFSVVLGDGEEFAASTVVVATGLDGVAHIPAELAGLSDPEGCGGLGLRSHSSEHRDLSRFAGCRVAVLGAGQSALENAALMAESGAEVEVFARGSAVVFAGTPTDVTHLGRGTLLKPESPLGGGWSLFAISHQAGAFRHLPEPTRLWLVAKVLGPFGAWWLRPRVDDRVPVHLDHWLVSAVPRGSGVQLTFATPSGELHVHSCDHVMAATGYRPDVDRLDFLDPGLRHQIARTAGTWPALGPAFNSSVPGLYFTGLAAAATFGPLMRFVCGTGFAAGRVLAHVGSARRAVAISSGS
jgi:cation diffusion facilitator CzcD-associated flavoprotein CzcO